MDLKFLPAKPENEPALADLLTVAFTPYVQKIGYDQSGPYPWLVGAIEQGRVFVAVAAEDTAGIIYLTRAGDEMTIEELGVDPAFQGQGIGRFLIAQVEEMARATGVRRMTLFTVSMMDELVQFYKRQGYRETHRALPPHGEDNHLRTYFLKDL